MLALIVIALVKIKHRVIMLAPVAISALVLSVGILLSTRVDGLQLVCLHKTKSETLVLATEQGSLVCDISDGSYSHLSQATSVLLESGKTVTDTLMLTHYHQAHATSALRYMENNLVRSILMPVPSDQRELAIMQSVYNHAEKCGVKAIMFETDKPVQALDGVNLTLTKEYIKRSTHPTLALCIETPASSACYIGASFHETNYKTVWGYKTADAETVIFGSHGPKIKTQYSYPLDNSQIHNIWFASEDAATYANMSDDMFKSSILTASTTMGGDVFYASITLN